ncbi:MAG: Pentachlorophenol monooxygenase [Novosphingobium lindaniclasticum]|jgi:2-polyprenyl-6-methoxyphenol hydroxylase-like FAD-dependent oxidoreductase|uniref:FAD-dependent monooxygenase n=1 Tax=Novosphingobium lindaniclasticum TaxID=1329895 RepID=UPI00240A7416|nr:FAD-dependent monooxygenase [Novosphingobium lindaniclasticum]MDF2640554.1 Pentachlorophenol monooxygenase [Novosphingobium lindaniclasticum]
MSKIHNEVLIVGGGPTGLIMAHELLRRRVPVRVIEKRQGPSHTTRAMTIHARSMEMFEHIGLAHRLEEVCLECPGNIYHFPHLSEEEQPRTDYRVLPTRFPFYYKINQNDFEQVLREHLFAQYSLRPEYQTELTGLVDRGDVVEATIQLPNGSSEQIAYPWVVGCDGVRSFVRDAAGIAFVGEEVAVMSMMDVPLTNVTFDDTWMNYYFNKDLFMNCTKLPGKYWRIYMSEPTGEYVYAKNQRQAFQDVADKLGIGFTVGEPEWVTAWQIRNNIAERYRTGRMLICGDASHVHSPSGGQGMNGCMQDAFNLGWKLAAIWNGAAEESILDSYERERKPIGEQISEGAMATHEIVMGFGIEPQDRLHYTREPGWEAKTINLVSGLSHNYVAVTQSPDGITAVAGPNPGERAPDALLVREPQKRVYDVLRHPQFTLLVIPGKDEERHVALGRAIRDELDRRFPGQVAGCLISGRSDGGFDFDHLVPDETGEVRERYQVGDEGRILLIRPDLYLGAACLPEEGASISEYLEQWFTPRVDAAPIVCAPVLAA